MSEAEVRLLGAIREEIVALWTSDVVGNQDVVLTARQRAHYLERHPEMLAVEELLQKTVLDPDEVHRNRRDAAIAVFYRRIAPGLYLRATVVMQAAPGSLKHSILTFRFARNAEVERNHHR